MIRQQRTPASVTGRRAGGNGGGLACTRRGLLRLAVAGVALALPRSLAASPGAVRLGWRPSPGDDARERGVRLGADEGAQLARLLGLSFELVQVPSDGPAPDGLAAVVAAEVPAGAGDGVWVCVGSRAAAGARVFRVPSSEERRRAAVARFASEAPPEELRAVDWHPSLVRYGAAQLNQRYERRFGAPMDEAAWAGWVGVKIALEAALHEDEGPDGLAGALRRLAFDGHQGVALTFDGAGALRHPVYVVRGERLLGEVAP